MFTPSKCYSFLTEVCKSMEMNRQKERKAVEPTAVAAAATVPGRENVCDRFASGTDCGFPQIGLKHCKIHVFVCGGRVTMMAEAHYS